MTHDTNLITEHLSVIINYTHQFVKDGSTGMCKELDIGSRVCPEPVCTRHKLDIPRLRCTCDTSSLRPMHIGHQMQVKYVYAKGKSVKWKNESEL